ncbi:hypothetical protein KSP40_PGU016890 [Platanthera guangdongensis]|uniref:GEX2 N-terminal Ig-like domain-containing protein n=1 Tax=Platanthera guangdongensis TaxID=2320717 RepID=A0ABR2MKY8_9ASPA
MVGRGVAKRNRRRVVCKGSSAATGSVEHRCTQGGHDLVGVGVKIPHLSFAISWLDDKTSYQAGDVATIKIKLLNNSLSGNLSTYKMHFSVSVSGKKGNSSYISAVFPYIDGDPTFWNISFTPIKVGDFSVVVVEDFSGVTDSTLHFSVTPACYMLTPLFCSNLRRTQASASPTAQTTPAVRPFLLATTGARRRSPTAPLCSLHHPLPPYSGSTSPSELQQDRAASAAVNRTPRT